MVLNLNSPHTMTFICMNWSAIIIFMEFKDYTQVHGMERHSVILFRTNSFFISSNIGMFDKQIVGIY